MPASAPGAAGPVAGPPGAAPSGPIGPGAMPSGLVAAAACGAFGAFGLRDFFPLRRLPFPFPPHNVIRTGHEIVNIFLIVIL